MITPNHIFLSSSLDIAEICKPLKNCGISYFSYTKNYQSGKRVYLTTNPYLLRNYFEKKFYLVGNCESNPANYQSQFVLWSTLPKQYLYKEARMFGVGNGLFLIKTHAEFVEFFGFGSQPENHMVINFYLNNIDYLQNFCSLFIEHAEKIIKQAEACDIILPYHQEKLPHFPSHVLNVKNTTIHKIKLTDRQLACMKLMLEGKTAKMIGATLNLSSRTIETYIHHLKRKLRCRNKSELITKFLQLDLGNK